MPERAPPSVLIWLYTVLAMIFVMVLIGGITRLTGSGLSMVDWHPLMDAIPPLSEAAWQEVFARYQTSPQYQQVNHWMGLAEFQQIFLWEYVHRLFGRLIGLVVALPWAWFAWRRRMPRGLNGRVAIAFVLGGMQGLLGWFMVKSGLVDRPEVSHFRLAAHLVLAFLVGQWIWWMILDLQYGGRPRAAVTKTLRLGIAAFTALVLLQIVYGAFMAGLRAGHLSATFPDMNGEYLPSSFFTEPDLTTDLLENPWAIHWTHRALGWTLLPCAIAVAFGLRGAPRETRLPIAVRALLATVAAQFLLGVLTVIHHVPVTIAVAHQGGAFLLLGACTLVGHRTTSRDANRRR